MASAEDRDAFIDALVGMARDPGGRTRVVVAIRADFFDRLLADQHLGPLVRDATFAVAPISPAGLADAISRPAERCGVAVEPALVAQIVADAADAAGSLPLVQFALAELFDGQSDGAMTLANYRQMGGLTAALTHRAEAVLDRLDDQGVAAVRRLYLRLVRAGEGTEDTRRRARRWELTSVPDEILTGFGAARLLTFDVDEVEREPTVEIAHEALIRHWPRLRHWLEEDREALRTHRHLADSALAWRGRGRDDGELYRGARLASAEEWLRAHRDDASPIEVEFLTASTAEHDRAANEERARQAARDRQNRVLRRLVAGVAAVAAVAMVATGLAVAGRRAAQRSADDAETARLAASAASVAQTNPVAGLLLAAESYRREARADTLGALQRAMLTQDRLLAFRGAEHDYLDVAIDGDTVLALRTGAIDTWTLPDLTPGPTLPIPGGAIADLYYRRSTPLSASAGWAAIAFADRAAIAFERATGRTVELGRARRTMLSPDPRRVVVLDDDLGIHMLELPSGAELWRHAGLTERTFADQVQFVPAEALRFPQISADLPGDVAFLPSGDIVVARGLRMLRLDGTTGAVEAESTEGARLMSDGTASSIVHHLVYEDGAIAASGVAHVATFDPETLRPTQLAQAKRNAGGVADFYTDTVVTAPGRRLLAESSGNLVEVDERTGDPLAPAFDARVGTVHTLAVDAARTRAVAVGSNGLSLMSLDGDRLLASALPRDPAHQALVGAALGDDVLLALDGSNFAVPDGPAARALRCTPPPTCREVPGVAEHSPWEQVDVYRRGWFLVDMRTWLGRRYDEEGRQQGGDITFGDGGYEGSVAVSTDGGWFAYASPTALRVHTLDDGHLVTELPLPSVLWWTVSAAPDGSVLYAFNQRSGQSLASTPPPGR